MEMDKHDWDSLLKKAFDYGKQLIAEWHDKKMQQIRLETANKRSIEEYKMQQKMLMAKYGKKSP